MWHTRSIHLLNFSVDLMSLYQGGGDCPGSRQGCNCTGIIIKEEECPIKDDAATWKATI